MRLHGIGGEPEGIADAALRRAAQSLLHGWRNLLEIDPSSQADAEVGWFHQSFHAARVPAEDLVPLAEPALVVGVGWDGDEWLASAAAELGLAYHRAPPTRITAAESSETKTHPGKGAPLLILAAPNASASALDEVLNQSRAAFDARRGFRRRRCLLAILLDCSLPSAGQANSGRLRSQNLEEHVRCGQFQVISDVRFYGDDDAPAAADRCWQTVLLTSEPRRVSKSRPSPSGFLAKLVPKDNQIRKSLISASDIVELEDGDPLFIKSNRAEYAYILHSGTLNIYYKREYKSNGPVDELGLTASRQQPVGDWEMGVPLMRGRYEGTAFASGADPTYVLRVPRPLFLRVLQEKRANLGWWLYAEFLRNNYDGAEQVFRKPQGRKEFKRLAGCEIRETRATAIHLGRYAISEAERLVNLDPRITIPQRGQAVMWDSDSQKKTEELRVLQLELNALRQSRYIAWACDGAKFKGAERHSYSWAPSKLYGWRDVIVSEFEDWLCKTEPRFAATFRSILSYGRDPEESPAEVAAMIPLYSVLRNITNQKAHVEHLGEDERRRFAVCAPVAFHLMRWLILGDAICIVEPFALHEVQADKPEANRTLVSKLQQRAAQADEGRWPNANIPLAEMSPVMAADLAAGMLAFAQAAYGALSTHLLENWQRVDFRLSVSERVVDRDRDIRVSRCLQDLIDQSWAVSVPLLHALVLHKDAEWLHRAGDPAHRAPDT